MYLKKIDNSKFLEIQGQVDPSDFEYIPFIELINEIN